MYRTYHMLNKNMENYQTAVIIIIFIIT